MRFDLTAPGQALGVVTFSASDVPVTRYQGCSIYTLGTPFVWLGPTSTGFVLPLPNDPALRGQTFRFQALWFGSGFSASNAVDVTPGD